MYILNIKRIRNTLLDDQLSLNLYENIYIAIQVPLVCRCTPICSGENCQANDISSDGSVICHPSP